MLAQNIMAAANDLRPVQARDNLESMMKRQLQVRREETQNLHLYVVSLVSILQFRKCEELESKLAQLRAPFSTIKQSEISNSTPTRADISTVGTDQVLQWAEGV